MIICFNESFIYTFLRPIIIFQLSVQTPLLPYIFEYSDIRDNLPNPICFTISLSYSFTFYSNVFAPALHLLLQLISLSNSMIIIQLGCFRIWLIIVFRSYYNPIDIVCCVGFSQNMTTFGVFVPTCWEKNSRTERTANTTQYVSHCVSSSFECDSIARMLEIESCEFGEITRKQTILMNNYVFFWDYIRLAFLF